ncbi:MAG: universal stress protein [Saezia sp.]
MKILLPVDGSEYTQKILDYIAAHTDIFTTSHEYMLLTIVPPLLPQAAGLLGKAAVDEYYKETSKQALDKAHAFLKDKGFHAAQGYKVGYVSEALPEQADNGGYDLVVMGTHGQSAWGNLMLGSVANAMLSRSKVPVLLIR